MNDSDAGFRVPDDQPLGGPGANPYQPASVPAGQSAQAATGEYVLTQSERNVAIAMHLMMLASLFMLPVVPGLVIWLVTKKDSAFQDWQGKEVVNAQLSWFAYAFIGVILWVLITLATGGLAFCLIFILVPAATLVPLIFCILGAVAASNGKPYQYPMIFRVLK
jgi:uncharacterized Tic20 family protein